jgi:prepilin-type N-terminal cleavage/methylation domain-containing protein
MTGLTRGASRARTQGGFTLVEILVVMAIVALLAALAIPALFRQSDKARDASAKAAVRTAQTAIEAYATDHGGSYQSATVTAADLAEIESTLNGADLLDPSPAAGPDDDADNSYVVTVSSANAPNAFSITRHAGGTVELTCSPDGQDGCPAGGRWGG